MQVLYDLGLRWQSPQIRNCRMFTRKIYFWHILTFLRFSLVCLSLNIWPAVENSFCHGTNVAKLQNRSCEIYPEMESFAYSFSTTEMSHSFPKLIFLILLFLIICWWFYLFILEALAVIFFPVHKFIRVFFFICY